MILADFAQKFQWTTIPPLNLLEENVFAGEIDISGTWDQYGLRLPSGAMALFLYCRETHKLEEEEDPDAWSHYNPDTDQDHLSEAVSIAEDIVHLSGSGWLVMMEDGKLKIENDKWKMENEGWRVGSFPESLPPGEWKTGR